MPPQTVGNAGISISGQAISLAAAAAGAGLVYAAGCCRWDVANTGAGVDGRDAVRLTSSTNPGAAAAIPGQRCSGLSEPGAAGALRPAALPTIDTASRESDVGPSRRRYDDPGGVDGGATNHAEPT